MIRLTLAGNTFSIKGELKADGFKWNAVAKVWSKEYADSEKERIERLANAWEDCGVYGTITSDVKPAKEKRYFVKEGWIFNLESMHDRLWCLQQDVRENKIALPFEVAGKTINSEDDLYDLQDEAETLEWKAKSAKGVTGKEYGRIKAIVEWRVLARYTACIANGMNETDAGLCFTDL